MLYRMSKFHRKLCVDAPDTDGVNAAAQANADISKEALDWFKAEAARTQSQRDATVSIQQNVANEQLATMRQQNTIAADYDAYNKTTYRPLEQSIVSDAQNYDTAERREAAAGQATTDVRAASNRATASTARTMARMGFDPSTNATKMAQQAALAEAGAATNARRQVEATGRAMRMDAASLGRGLPSAQATAIQTGIGAAGQAATSAGMANASAASAADLMGRGFSTGIAGNQSSGNLYAQAADLSSRNNLGGWLNAAGGIGYAMGAQSSKAVKHRRAQMNSEQALEALHDSSTVDEARSPRNELRTRMGDAATLKAVNRLDVDVWTYKPGVADSRTHIGPYAEDMHREFGDRAAPEGRMIDLREASDNNAAAIRALSRELETIETRINSLARKRATARA